MSLIRRRIEIEEKRPDDVGQTPDVKIVSDDYSCDADSELSASLDSETSCRLDRDDFSIDRDGERRSTVSPSDPAPESERDVNPECRNDVVDVDSKRGISEVTDETAGRGDTAVAVQPLDWSNRSGPRSELDDRFFTDNSSTDSFVTADSSERPCLDEIFVVPPSTNGRWNACCLL